MGEKPLVNIPVETETPPVAKLEPSPLKKKLDEMKKTVSQEERNAQVASLRKQIETLEKQNEPFAEQLKKMGGQKAAEAAANLKKTFASVAGGDLNAAAFALQMAKLTPEMQHQAMKHLDSLKAENLTTHKLSTIALLEMNQLKLMTNQLALHMDALSKAVAVVGLRQEELIAVISGLGGAAQASQEKKPPVPEEKTTDPQTEKKE